jgi:hypothetical protein
MPQEMEKAIRQNAARSRTGRAFQRSPAPIRCRRSEAKGLLDPRIWKRSSSSTQAAKLYRQIVEEHPDSPHADQAKTCLTELEKVR